jgi:hypothetical protein
MSAFDIFKQSFNFYGRLFNKIFWLSVAYTLVPMLVGGTFFGVAAANENVGMMFLGVIVMLLAVCFFYAYQVMLIDQFSKEQNDSLKDALPKAIAKTLPFLRASLALGVVFILVMIPIVGLAGAFAGENLTFESDPVRFAIFMLIILGPVAWLAYRLIFVPFHVMIDGSKVFTAFGKSNQQAKSNWLVFKGLTLLGLIMMAYMVVLLLLQFMIALNPIVMAFVQFAFGVLFSPFFTIYLYRLFIVTKPISEPETEGEEQ